MPPRAGVGQIDFDSTVLLDRRPRDIDLTHATGFFTDKRVMITGAGGTIGAELARQIAALAPSSLILVDNAEYNLYRIDQELNEDASRVPVSAHLVDVCRARHLDRVFSETKPQIVLHAAAYKHVPIAEANMGAAALTNILGARTVFEASIAHGAEAVVFVSTDKAVNPVSFMGATKRVAELHAQALDIAQSDTRFVTVRFGNVLGSTGSVAPLFQRQIARGGPVTVTHPDVQRYFMTRKEAAQLVLTAAALSDANARVVTHDGRIFVLDMGDPVHIVTLAERMIEGAGLTAGRDIEISFTGLRPGEKLFEEVFHELEHLVRTGVDGLLLASPTMIDLPLLEPRLNEIIRLAEDSDDAGLAAAIHHLVPEFRGSIRSSDGAANSAPESSPARRHQDRTR